MGDHRHPYAKRIARALVLALVKLNVGHCWLTKQQANEALIAAVIASNPAADPEKVREMVESLWECKT